MMETRITTVNVKLAMDLLDSLNTTCKFLFRAVVWVKIRSCYKSGLHLSKLYKCGDLVTG